MTSCRFPSIRFIAAAGLLAALLTAGATAPVQGQEPNLGTFTDWIAYDYDQSGAKRCTMASQPKKDEGDYTKRGAIWAFVMHRPKEGATGEVGFFMGYPLKEGSLVKVTIGGQTFDLFTSGEGAYAWPEDEPKLIAAMRGGASMVVKGVSARGTNTTDTYSLSGFTAAKGAIDKECGVK